MWGFFCLVWHKQEGLEVYAPPAGRYRVSPSRHAKEKYLLNIVRQVFFSVLNLPKLPVLPSAAEPNTSLNCPIFFGEKGVVRKQNEKMDGGISA